MSAAAEDLPPEELVQRGRPIAYLGQLGTGDLLRLGLLDCTLGGPDGTVGFTLKHLAELADLNPETVIWVPVADGADELMPELTERRAPTLSFNGRIALSHERHELLIDNETLHLPNKEYLLLSLLLANRGQIVTFEKLYTYVWGDDYNRRETLTEHVNRLRKKLGGAGWAITTMRHVGYRLDDLLAETPPPPLRRVLSVNLTDDLSGLTD